MEFLIALVIIAAVIFAIIRLRKTFSREIGRAKSIKRANDSDR